MTYVKLCSRYRFGHESKPCSVEIAMNDLPRRINHALLTTLQVPRCVYLFRDFFSLKLILFSFLVINALCNIIMTILQEKFSDPFPLFGPTSNRFISRYFSLLHFSWQPRFSRQFFIRKKLTRKTSKTGFFYPLISDSG